MKIRKIRALSMLPRRQMAYHSFDDGKLGSKSSAQSGFVYAVAVHPKNKCVIFASNGREVFRTDDCLRSWTKVDSELRSDVSVRTLAFNPFPPYQIFQGKTNGDILQSFDSGNGWQMVKKFNKRLVNLIASPLKENLLYAIMKEDGLYRSEDGGASWCPQR